MSQDTSGDGLVRVRRALLSVSDKAGIVAFARSLAGHGVALVSTGGTARLLAEEGLEVTEVSDLTGFPEMLGGRVKTLHPKVHGGILGVEHDPAHRHAMDEHGIVPFDLVCVNLYPFERVAADPDATDEALIEQIDIGGPAMIRSAAKNHERVTIVTDPAHYDGVLDVMGKTDGSTDLALRRRLCVDAFRRTARYDAAISARLGHFDDAALSHIALSYERHAALRYGENPHQHAGVYRGAGASTDAFSLTAADVLHGKALSFNNYNDASGAVALAWELHRLRPLHANAVVVKHTNPCGASSAEHARAAIEGALAGDPMAAYGGIMAMNRVIDEESAAPLCAQGVFLEVIVAPGFTDTAFEMLRAKSANVRLLAIGPFPETAPVSRNLRSLIGGDLLVQDADLAPIDVSAWAHVAGPVPDEPALGWAGAVWAMCKHLSSNAIAIGGPDRDRAGVVRLFGAGAGQMDRVAACRNAVEKAGASAHGAIAASDAFFPFPDGPERLIDAGVRTIVQPGGSKRDADTFALCEERGVTCLTTGVRHFRH